MYAKQVLWEAVGALATGDGSIQERLAIAAGSHGPGLIKLVGPAHNDLPEELQDEFRAIWRELNKEGSVSATTNELTGEECRQLAKRIFDIYTDIMGGL
jgi:hypothetical protein